MPDFGRWNNAGGDPSLNEINRTDQFLDALAGQQPVYATDRGEAELAQLLAGWRDNVRETPMNDVVTLQDAAVALDRVTSPARRRRLSLAVVGSTAAAVLCLGGFGAVIAGSGPGDALYGLRTVLFGDSVQTRDDAVALAAQTEMQQVQKLIDQGDWQGAQQKLQAVTTTVATVGDDQRKAELVTQWQELTVKVEAQNPAATVPPGAPLPTFPVVSIDPNTVVLPPPSETSSPSDTTSGTSSPTSSAPTDTSSTAPSSTSSATSSTTSSVPAGTTTPSSSAAATPSSAVAPSTTATTTQQPTPSSTTTRTVPSSSTAATTSAVTPTTTTSVVVQQSTTTVAPRVTTAEPPSAASPSAAPTRTTAPAIAVPSSAAAPSAPAEPAIPTTTTAPAVPEAPR
ncbi:hypothetical protein FK535_21370 [Mycolicibacterium sp. 018/SC-01/001]|uniref:anti-sigma-D factor RsdA n=1 Tax=Mycolicibacterium sp. 018/SC-01/001 TaxID=2592069 RepID=UPI00117EC747|nr:anti-sigma-D factor RsdA [Mycolicibacterium sp. 018/SC-01/001]TRW79887.1 hypothetical protein FK535_21370 [Mycolicibacterium sp. 018/SC-01/001]